MYVIAVCAPLGTLAIRDVASRFVDLAGKQCIVINESSFRLDIEETASPECQDLSTSNYVKIDDINTDHDYLIKQGVNIAYEEIFQKINSYKDQKNSFLLVIGHRLYLDKQLRALASVNLFMENSPEKCLAQYLYSDPADPVSMVKFYETMVKPVNDEQIIPAKIHADIVIPENGNLDLIFDLLLAKINSLNLQNEDTLETEVESWRSNSFFS